MNFMSGQVSTKTLVYIIKGGILIVRSQSELAGDLVRRVLSRNKNQFIPGLRVVASLLPHSNFVFSDYC